MRGRGVVTAVAVSSVLALAALRPALAGSREEEAEAAARSWLALVDRASYAESWNQAAPLFKKTVTQDKWKEMVVPVREPLGKVVSRTLKSRDYTESLPGAPDGHYVVIRFTTDFEQKKGAVETLVPMESPDGMWRVSGYFVQ
jgi:Protein of unknown function (DUF4019)